MRGPHAVLTSLAGVYAGQALHVNLASNILRAPITFFDVTPIGRILNRFTKVSLFALHMLRTHN